MRAAGYAGAGALRPDRPRHWASAPGPARATNRSERGSVPAHDRPPRTPNMVRPQGVPYGGAAEPVGRPSCVLEGILSDDSRARRRRPGFLPPGHPRLREHAVGLFEDPRDRLRERGGEQVVELAGQLALAADRAVVVRRDV